MCNVYCDSSSLRESHSHQIKKIYYNQKRKGIIMTQAKYLCYFDSWNGFMDGQLMTDDFIEDYDFVDIANKDSDEENLLIPFTEEEARKHFIAKGYTDITFVYDEQE
jgi:hypothetical protein